MSKQKQADGAQVDRLAALADLVANPTRVRILEAIRSGEVPVGTLAEQIGVSVSGVSQHMAKMKAHGLVKGRRDAQTMYYAQVPGVLAEMKSLLAEIVG